jgi:hypothetical protein
MSCLTSAQRTAILAEIADIDEMIAAIKAAYLSALGNSEIETYRFDSGDGSQRADRRSPKELKDQWDDLLAMRGRLVRQLRGTLNVTLNFRRRRGRYGRRYGY